MVFEGIRLFLGQDTFAEVDCTTNDVFACIFACTRWENREIKQLAKYFRGSDIPLFYCSKGKVHWNILMLTMGAVRRGRITAFILVKHCLHTMQTIYETSIKYE